jgi:4-hydroxybenzoyl-CoA reductase subunit beta
MLRLPPFRYLVPAELSEAVTIKAEHGSRATYVAGGTDLLPKMKRRQQEPEVLIQLGHLPELSGIRNGDGAGLRIGANTTLAALAADPVVRRRFSSLAEAAGGVGNPVVRNMATLGGNVCLETRCSYYDQSHEWREAVSFCLKKDGDTCRVAGSSQRCWAIQSSDTSPLMIALGAQLELSGPSGSRVVEAASFYNDDGVRYLNKEPDEVVTGVRLPSAKGGAAAYLKVSRRLSVDYPVLSVAAWIRREAVSAPVLEARVVLGAVGSAPVIVSEAKEILTGRSLSRVSIEETAEAAWRRARPLDNADQSAMWRKKVVRPYVARALHRLAPSQGEVEE